MTLRKIKVYFIQQTCRASAKARQNWRVFVYIAKIMLYHKPAKTYEEQAQILIDRGLIADQENLVRQLKAVNYYRLSGYLHTYRLLDVEGHRLDIFYPGTKFTDVWNRYRFDRQLRLLILDGIERIEVAIKTQVTYVHSHTHGAFGYIDRASLPRLSAHDHQALLRRIKDETERSREDFVKHFFSKYGDHHKYLPLWMAVEIMSFGSVLSIFHGMEKRELKQIARQYDLNVPLLDSWITALNGIRNLCAHHARVWNRILGSRPKIPDQDYDPQWHCPIPTPGDRIFAVLTVEKYLLDRIAPQSRWAERLRKLIETNPSIPLRFMGFPENWRAHSVWQ